MMNSVLKDAIATAKLADKLQRTNPKLTKAEAVKQAIKTQRETEN